MEYDQKYVSFNQYPQFLQIFRYSHRFLKSPTHLNLATVLQDPEYPSFEHRIEHHLDHQHGEFTV